MQSGFGVNFLFWPSEFEENCRWISQRNLMANFDSEFFGLVFPGFQAHPKNSRPKFTSRIVGIPLQCHFLEPTIYSRRFSAYVGDQDFFRGFQRGVFVRGGEISIIGVVRAPVAILNFASNPCENL